MASENFDQANQYLTFKLDDELYGINIFKVREVMDMTGVTYIPRTPAFMRGIINLRGSVVPVIDLKMLLMNTRIEKTINTCIIILEIMFDGELTLLGALADSVQEVLELKPEEIEPAPKIGTRLDIEFIQGIGKTNDDFITILDINKLFSFDDISVVNGVKNTTEELVVSMASFDK